MKAIAPEAKYAIDWWRARHAEPRGYFPLMEQHWNWKLYTEMPGWWLKYAEPVAGDRALEIGCGYGQWMNALSRLVASVDGFDIHQSLLDKFTEQLGGKPNLRMRIGDGVAIPFDRTYSLIYSISVFQHMPRAIVAAYIKESKQLLADSGRCIFHFRHADNVGPYSEDIAVDHTGDWSVGWTEQEAVDACTAADLKVDRVEARHSLIVKAVHA